MGAKMAVCHYRLRRDWNRDVPGSQVLAVPVSRLRLSPASVDERLRPATAHGFLTLLDQAPLPEAENCISEGLAAWGSDRSASSPNPALTSVRS